MVVKIILVIVCQLEKEIGVSVQLKEKDTKRK
jgi:hypothetical protein